MSLPVADSKSGSDSIECLSAPRSPFVSMAMRGESVPTCQLELGHVAAADFMDYVRKEEGPRECPSPADTASFNPPEGKLADEFFARVAPGQPFRMLFDHVPGVFFFAKNAQSRLMYGSSALLERLGVNSERDFVGRCDHDFFPAEIADRFMADDETVLRTGRPLLDRFELWYTDQHILDWFVTTKLPLFDSQGRLIGLAGTTRSYEGRRRALSLCCNLTRVIDYLSAHLGDSVSVADLAKVACLSDRQLRRKIRVTFRVSVQQLIIKTRIQHAAEALLKSDRCLSTIAAEYGFCDQSAFSRQFRLHTGVTPLKFRQRAQ